MRKRLKWLAGSQDAQISESRLWCDSEARFLGRAIYISQKAEATGRGGTGVPMQWRAEGPKLSGAGNTALFAGGSLWQSAYVRMRDSTTGGCNRRQRGGITGHGGLNRVYFRFPGVATTQTWGPLPDLLSSAAGGTAKGCHGSGYRPTRSGSPGTERCR